MLVSIITPTTKAREPFLKKLLGLIAAQDYPHIEHVIIPDEGLTIGAKRNMACERAKGDIIVHMDDDDWYATDWVSKSVRALQESGADVTGLGSAYFINEPGQKYQYTSDSSNYVMGATMCYRRIFWKQHPFKDIQIGEDNKFIWDSKCRVYPHGYIDGFLSRLHAGNTSPKRLEDKRWKRIS
jgi:glycosyltransferase involved in cell wall biosynthesis